MPAGEWGTAEHAERYLARADAYPRRAEADSALLERVPDDARRVLDLGTGDGRVLGLLARDRPEMLGVGIDISEPMLQAGRERFEDSARIKILEHDLGDPLPRSGASTRSSPRLRSTTSNTSESTRSTARSWTCSNPAGSLPISSMWPRPRIA
jgi:SAM-dependent methyltransferase